MEHLNKVTENLQSDTLEERLYLQLNNWKKIVGDDLFNACFPKSFKNLKTKDRVELT